jgi:hypothetical protein
MKSSFELALERTGGTLKKVSEGLKEKIAEIDRKYQAKMAEAELALRDRFARAKDIEERRQIQEDFVVEQASIRSKWEQEKEKARTEK